MSSDLDALARRVIRGRLREAATLNKIQVNVIQLEAQSREEGPDMRKWTET